MTAEKNQEPHKNDLDIIEATIGPIGRWQILMTCLISLVWVHISWVQLGIIFLAPEPKFWCSNTTLDKCSSDCPEHVFDRSVFTETIITEWDLVCDRQYYINKVLQPLVMAGILFGSLFFGYISDRFGRKYPLILAVLLEGILGVVAAFVPWLELFLVLKFLSTICVGGIVLIGYIIAMELIGNSYRTTVGVLFHFPYFFGYAGMGLLGYLIRDWHYFQLAISVTNFIFIIFIWAIPESPRWLISTGRTEESIDILMKAAKTNKLSTYNIKEKVQLHEKQLKEANSKAGNYMDLIRTNEMRKRTICISVVTFAGVMVFFGVSQYLGNIGENAFFNVAFSGFIQIPGSIAVIFILDRIGRRNSLIISIVSGGIACLLIIAIPANTDWAVTLLGAFGIMFSGMAVTICRIYSGELYPTVIRSMGMGTAAMVGKFGSTIAPFFLDLKDEHPWLPPMILGVVAVLAGLFCIGLPETMNRNLPETIEEAEEISTKNKKDLIISVIAQ